MRITKIQFPRPCHRKFWFRKPGVGMEDVVFTYHRWLLKMGDFGKQYFGLIVVKTHLDILVTYRC